jgi:N-acetylglucosaminyldiphosphoundecaprenol N-acetyl-beta-D-mannosaminyltransferase
MLTGNEPLIDPTDPIVGQPSTEPPNSPDSSDFDRVSIWGVPLARLTYQETLDEVECLIRRREPAFFVTANLHYAMLSNRHERLRSANDRAAFLVADGMPMVWYSRITGRPLPERVAGADLIHMLLHRAADRGHKVFLLGGTKNVAQEVARISQKRYPSLRIVGLEAPMIDQLSPHEHERLIARIRRARPDLLLVAFGQPKGELWLADNCQALGVPACVQLGASFDFLAGRIRRAPRWLGRIGGEWLYRIASEPKRMIPRYFQDALFLFTAIARDLVSMWRTDDRRHRKREGRAGHRRGETSRR